MDWKRLTAPVALCLLLAACTPAAGPAPTAAPVPTAPVATPAPTTPWTEDYDLFWDILDENYPYLSAAARITGEDYGQVREEYRPYAQQARSAPELLWVIQQCGKTFQGTGHLLVFDSGWYANYMAAYDSDTPKSAYLHAQIDTPQARALYGYEPPDEAASVETGTIRSAGLPVSLDSDNLNARLYPEEGAAYVAVASMARDYAPDQAVLADFFRDICAQGYEHCILDIRGNGGGSDSYWRRCIVDPNGGGGSTTKNYALIKGPLSTAYFDAVGLPLSPIGELPLDELPALAPGDLEGITHFATYELTRPSEEGGPLFPGRFWLLVDGAVYSSSEKFAMFCKQSGFATLVGTETGGDGVGIDPLLCALPHSGICFRFSAENGLNLDGGCNEEMGTAPDIPIEKGQDALEVCLAYCAGDLPDPSVRPDTATP